MTRELKESLKVLGFVAEDGKDNVYIKKYNNYDIKVKYNEKNPEKSEIDYGTKILCNRKTTCNFHQDETFVVLECVNRLLEKGYKPENIELEKAWGMGHTEGYLDILVKDEQNASFAMIECKTWDKEYYKYVKETYTHKNKSKENDGGQIFSYLQQEPKTTKAICYYTSHISGKSVEYKNAIILNKEDWSELNQVERFNRWSKTFETNGIFDNEVPLYKVESKAIRRKDLKELKREDSDGIYNQFAEILRHNVVSDKPNAFNKIINLFLCKIWDEDRCPDDEVKFQTRTNGRDKSDEELLEDLNDLYKAGMKAYLEKDVSDCTKNDFETLLSFVGDSSKKSEFEELYKTLRLYKNNEFAFKEVYDKKSFKENAKVVREVVELLQYKQLRYSHKQQFLGDFFEKLLNDSIKQEAGQYFTPVPLTQFIIKSLPIEEMIKTKISNGEQEVLPYVIDYACGTGHFLTEIMDTMNDIIKNNIDLSSILKPSVQREFKNWQASDFEWAEKYIYGIDLDYRLIKASKISCFLNGDGKANLLHANGLAPFDSEDYVGKLHNPSAKQDNQKFDILIANPPYSVKEFGKHALTNGKNCFTLFNELTEKSNAIECFFIERAKQLVKENGYVGIVLPVTVLTNDKIYQKARELLLKYFDIKGILSLYENAFYRTNTKTVILLMKRRENTYWEKINLIVNKFFENYIDVTVAGIEKGFTKFVQKTYPDLNLEDYVSILKNNPTENAKKSELCTDYSSIDNKKILSIEKDKLLYFFLTYNSKIVLANSGEEKNDEKFFLGYEFSNRKGSEGIKIYKNKHNNTTSCLFSDVNKLDTNKLNTYMYKHIIGNDIAEEIYEIKSDEEHALFGHIDYCRLSDLIDFSLPKSEKNINLNLKNKVDIESKYEQERFQDLVSYFEPGVTYDNKDVSSSSTNNIILTADNITLGNQFKIRKQIFLNNDFEISKDKQLVKDDIFICLSSGSKKHVGKVAYIDNDTDYYAGGFMGIIRANKDVILPRYLFYVLQHPVFKKTLEVLSLGSNINNLCDEIDYAKLPKPPIEIQKEIIAKISPIENELAKMTENAIDLQNKINALYSKLYNKNEKNVRLSNDNIFSVSIGKRVLKNELISNAEIPVYSANVQKPFGYTDELLIKEFDNPSVLWGIDGEWMVNYINKGVKFYPTDHCGVLRLKNNDMLLEKYVAYALEEAGKDFDFSRTKRASIDRIKDIKIPVPDIEEQKRTIAEILPLEKRIEKLQKDIDEIPAKKQAILDKYLK